MEQVIEYLVVLLIILGAVLGLMKGFITIFFSWISIILGAVAALKFSFGLTYSFFPQHAENVFIVFLMGMVIFSLVYILLLSIGRSFASSIDKYKLGGLDYLLGCLFGAAQVMFLVGILVYKFATWRNMDMHPYPISMFAMYWSEKILALFGYALFKN
ncbi:MAG: CvpA family protein [Brevinemataceae bacterium]